MAHVSAGGEGRGLSLKLLLLQRFPAVRTSSMILRHSRVVYGLLLFCLLARRFGRHSPLWATGILTRMKRMQTPANMPGHVSSAACRPGNDLVPFRRVVGAVCVRVVHRLLGIRR
jgi:hypothetical protein